MELFKEYSSFVTDELWLSAGDFNIVHDPSESFPPCESSYETDIVEFVDYLHGISLFDHQFLGCYYT